ncbi:MAG: hypothetical protein JWL61_2681 [Gemmatimonadetes bacterium]|nr:hypothetical protein [Gemmatimonadota bacterium]
MRRLIVSAIAVLVLAPSARAQGGSPVELGLDGALSYGLDSPHFTFLSVPIQRLRAGFFVTPTVSIEPTAALNYSRVQGSNSTSFDFGAGALFHMAASRTAAQPYVRPFVEFGYHSFDSDPGSSSFTTTTFGAGLGVKIPIANRFAWRFEGAYSHSGPENRVTSKNQLTAFFGLSLFLH